MRLAKTCLLLHRHLLPPHHHLLLPQLQHLKWRRKTLPRWRRSFRYQQRCVYLNINCAHDIVCLLHWISIEKVLCEECGQKMARSSLKRHKNYIHPVKRVFYPCEPPCKTKFRTLENLKAHKKRNSCRAGKEIICIHCNQNVQGSLKEHLDKNICSMQFLCSDCGQSFRLKGALKAHKRKGCD